MWSLCIQCLSCSSSLFIIRYFPAAQAGCDLLPSGDRCPLHSCRAALGSTEVAVQQRRRVPGRRHGDQPQVAWADIRHWRADAFSVNAIASHGEIYGLRFQLRVDGRLLLPHTVSQCLKFFSCCGFVHQKEERTMLEDTKAALSDLDKVTVFFRQLEDECLVASKRRGHNQTLPLVQVPLQLTGSCRVWLPLNNIPLCGFIGAIEDLLFFSFSGKWLNRESVLNKSLFIALKLYITGFS